MRILVVFAIVCSGATCSADPIAIRIGSLGTHKSRENLSISIAPYQMAAKDFGRRTNDKFSFTLTFLRTRPAETSQMDCLYRGDDADQMIAQWFYQQRDEKGRRFEVTPAGLIQTGCIDRSTVHLLAAEWNILSITSVASQRDPKIQFAIGSTSLFLGSVSVSTYVDTIRNLLRLHRWDSVYMLLDNASDGVYGAIFEELIDGAATGTAGPASGFYRLRTTITVNTPLEPFLVKFSTVSRGRRTCNYSLTGWLYGFKVTYRVRECF
ncbi:hypothetical protein BV898_08938 [Hypsibius exemplaris]|uniref:Receptor ligand binding region domain-containing protein n=1 Tax=Hypsibius exemplaris TaxID=2072580 RepID=A0A1W0WP33_HYPEX|nr:hypothetical protein BV898_08938 [Hypsibius exemplaris]